MGDRRMSDDAGQDLRPFRKKLYFFCFEFHDTVRDFQRTQTGPMSDLALTCQRDQTGLASNLRHGLSAVIRHGTRHTRR